MRELDAEALFAHLVEVWPEPPVTPEVRVSYLANFRAEWAYAVTTRRALEALRFSARTRPTPLDIYNATEQQNALSAERGEHLREDTVAIPLREEPQLTEDEHLSRIERVRRITDNFLRSIGEKVTRVPGQPRE